MRRSHLLSAAGFFLLAITLCSFLLVSCLEEPVIKERKQTGPPAVSAISPLGGIHHMHLTIVGENFSDNVADHTVLFNGLEAKVVSATSTKLVVEIPENGTTGPVTLITASDTIVGPEFQYYDIYLLTFENFNVSMWKNGVKNQLNEEGTIAVATAFTITDNGDVYIAGTVNGGLGYWKNDEKFPLSAPFGGGVFDIAVDGEDVYVSGSQVLEEGSNSLPAYWKNGTVHNLGTQYEFGEARKILVDQGNVYVGGTVFNGTRVMALYWKDETEVELAIPEKGGHVLSDLKIIGNDLHALTFNNGYKGRVRHWVNGTPEFVSDGTYSSAAFAMSLIGSDVYVGGTEYIAAGTSRGVLWKNGQVLLATDELSKTVITEVAIVGNDIIIAGQAEKNGGWAGFYAVNGFVTWLSEGGAGVHQEVKDIEIRSAPVTD